MKILNYHNTPILIGVDFGKFEQLLTENTNFSAASKLILLIDANVYSSGAYNFDGFDFIVVPAGEGSKSLSYVEELIEQLLDKGLDRSGFLVGIGGGVVCDLTGFVASVFMRGIDFAFVPTSLLAQVDAAIGGKNGVNLASFKNMIGTFTQPKMILIDLKFLLTLPQNELISGMAEVVKHAAIRDANYFVYLENHIAGILSRNTDILMEVVLRSVEIKAQIVQEDELERGLRKLLNFGHTFGHAIEKTLHIPHGEAVSLGMCVVNRLAVLEGHLEVNDALRMENLLNRIGLPTDWSKIKLTDLEPLIFKDKKRNAKRIDFVLLSEIGSAFIAPKSFDDIHDLIVQI